MRPAEPNLAPKLSRRALGVRIAAAAAAVGISGHRAAAVPAPAPMDPALREAALRGLALAGLRGDPVGAAAARAAVTALADTDPEGALLVRLYRKLDVRPAAYWHEGMQPGAAGAASLALLHDAIAGCLPVVFDYTDMGGNPSRRAVLPLALVHPPQGVKLLAWCCEREDFRQFFVRAMEGLAAGKGDFSDDRLALLEGLAEKEGA